MITAQKPLQSRPEQTLARVRACGPAIDASAAAREHGTEVSAAVIGELQAAGLFALMAPAELGGDEAHPELLIDALSEVAYFDGSTGWYAGAVMTAAAVAGAFLGPAAVAEMFCGPAMPLAAGQAAPLGRAQKVGDSYQISGTFAFGSGVPTADWIVGGYGLYEGDQPVLDGSGAPVQLIAFAPRSRVDFLGNWDVLGLRGTGSYDFRVREQRVHRDFAFQPAASPLQRGGPLFRMGFFALPALTHSAFALGCARRALEGWRDFAQRKSRAPGQPVNATATFQRDIAMAHAELRAAEAYVRRTFSALYDAAAAGEIEETLKLDGRLCASHALRVGAQVAQAAYAGCTTEALRDGSVVQRCFRDLQAGNAHVMTGEQSWIDAGRVLGGVPGAVAIF